ncbi:excinuclease ABC subunit UvrC [Patescibacteria group bacterium]|nr:excinuclease ABC subunit UvrC [Patescibacteria group bacterium]MBU0963587.1 excinuclease ABC subunit UvrC [Patescibacteria group bacterium]
MAISNPKTIPQKPGVYLFKDAQGNILYIGKAASLKNRVASYFHQSNQLTPHKKIMVEKISKVEFIVTSSPTEALLLESNLIKKHQPPFNIDLKDDKNFKYIKITVNEEFPRVFTVRQVLNDKAKYFGPYVSAISVNQTLNFLRKLFPHRNFAKQPSQQQLGLLIQRYPQLIGPLDKNEYNNSIKKVINFLKGHYEDIISDLEDKMKQAAVHHSFEKAAGFRDKISAIEKIMARQKVVTIKKEKFDIISLAREEDMSVINLFNIRYGKLINKQNFVLKNTADQQDYDIIQAFIEQLYPRIIDRPRAILVPIKLPNQGLIERTFKTKIIVPRKGDKKKLIKLGEENADIFLNQIQASWQKDEARITTALTELKEKLQLEKIPLRVEIFDISNIQGQNAVGSMVVFTNGHPDKKWYRKFKIKTVTGANDPAMMAEVLWRRFNHAPSPQRGEGQGEGEAWPQPDLVILDGGKGQLSVVQKNVKINCPIIALAKKKEEIYLPGRLKPFTFPANSEVLFLIQRMRDEAHRFAITFFRQKHSTELTKSPLDNISGIGPKTKKLLIRHFGSVQNLKNTTPAELEKIIGHSKTNKIIKQL